MAAGGFEVRKLPTQEEVCDIIFARAAALGWRPGTLDYVSYFAADKTGFFVGELNGKPISCISVIKHTNNFAFVGTYLVDKEYHGKGYGLKTWNAAMASINESYNLSGDTTTEMLPVYSKFVPIRALWCQQCFDFVLPAHFSAETHNTVNSIEPPTKSLFPAILEYDTEVHVYPRPSFLEKWVFAPNCYCSVAIDTNGCVVGYGVVRKTQGNVSGWRIAPLFADSADIARILYRDMCAKVAAEDSEANMTVDVSYGEKFSPESLNLVAGELQGKPTFTMFRVYKYLPPNMPLNKIFVII